MAVAPGVGHGKGGFRDGGPLSLIKTLIFRKDPVAVADAYGGAVAFEVFSAPTLGETGAQEPCRPVGDGKIGGVLVQAVQDRGAFFDEEQSPVRQAVCEEKQITPFPGGGIEGFPDAAG